MYLKAPKGKYYNIYKDMLEQPHLLIAGTTGSGKSTIINAMIYTALYKLPVELPIEDPDRAEVAQFIFIDPKRVELAAYKYLPHTLAHAVGIEERRVALDRALNIMEARYVSMEERGLKNYDGGDLYVIIDEFADLIDDDKKNIVPRIRRLSAEGRAAKVHVILATQTPMAEILPSKIRNNFPWRVCLCMDNAVQSRLVLGRNGCENLPWHGQGYYKKPGPGNTVLCGFPDPYTQEQLDERVSWWTNQVA